jgi:arylsulfatase A-like enzyme
LFTGLYPAVHGVRDKLGFRVPENVTTIAERLAARGFSTGAVLAAPVVGRESGIGGGGGSFEDPSREDRSLVPTIRAPIAARSSGSIGKSDVAEAGQRAL